MEVGKSYKITVKKYMTEPATANFDFQDKWNNGKPMPLCIMQGEVIKETRGMYYMKLKSDDGKVNVYNCDKNSKKEVIKTLPAGKKVLAEITEDWEYFLYERQPDGSVKKIGRVNDENIIYDLDD